MGRRLSHVGLLSIPIIFLGQADHQPFLAMHEDANIRKGHGCCSEAERAQRTP
jgi:hypothetical protein